MDSANYILILGHPARADLQTAAVDDAFVLYLLEIIEGVSDYADDPYHYPVIRVLVGTPPSRASFS